MARAAPIITSFNAGELSKNVEGRVEIAKYPSGCRTMENFIMTVQGPAKRRGGTKFISEVKDSDDKTWIKPFVFSVDQAYILEFGPEYIRFYTDHGVVNVASVSAWVTATAYEVGDLREESGVNYYCLEAHTSGTFATDLSNDLWYALTGTIYEIPTPYLADDLTAADGTFKLRLVQSNDVIYIASESHPVQKLSRFSATNWTLTEMQPIGGPFKTQNITATTVYAGAETGNTTLTASDDIFEADHVGSLFYVGQKSVLSVKQWEAGKAITAGDLRRSDGKNYEALNSATTGGGKPVHTEGAEFDGDSGVQWEFKDPGFGVVLITGYTSATEVDVTVMSTIPANAVGSGNASTRWAYGAWSDVEGWPSQVTFYKERLVFARGATVWLSVAGDFETFTSRDDGGVVTADMAITVPLQADETNDAIWLDPGDALVVGTAGAEFAIKSITDNSPFGPENYHAPRVSKRGSRPVPPVRVGDITLFVQQSGIKLRDFEFDGLTLKFLSTDQNTLADHITKSGILEMAYQQEPNSIIWAVLANGSLVAMTYSREQYETPPYGGWHRHPIGGSFAGGRAVVESVASIPAPARDRDELWLVIKRTVNGSTVRYVEYMEYEFDDESDPETAFFVDSGLTLNNTRNAILTPGANSVTKGSENVLFTANVNIFTDQDVGQEIHYRYSTIDPDDEKTLIWTTAKAEITGYTDEQNVVCKINQAFPTADAIAANEWKVTALLLSGFDHLEGETLDVLVDGATHPPVVVQTGFIGLQYGGSRVTAGYGSRARLQPMRLNAGARNGTSQGKPAYTDKLVVRLLSTLGLKVGKSFSADDLQELNFRNALDQMDNPPPLFTGDFEVDWPGDIDTDTPLCFEQADPQPCTIVAIMPNVSVYDG